MHFLNNILKFAVTQGHIPGDTNVWALELPQK